MELRGTNDAGKTVVAPIPDLAEKMRQSGEEMTYGDTPTHVVYANRYTGAKRQVDLQEVAQGAGIKNVHFEFDPAAAEKAGMYQDKDIDQSTAYNLERIKTDDLRQKYLADKGYKPGTVYQDGDDYYSYVDGKFSPINNKPGFDVSDLTRMAAHAGRDIGAATGATAAVGGGILGAAPSGGTSVVAGLATAGAMGAAGGTLGEEGQRSVDRIMGTDAAKYNDSMGVVEELKSRGKDAAMGAVAGVAQPLMNAGVAKLGESVVAPALDKLGTEWSQTAAAKLKMGGVAARLPQGFAQKFGSEEQMAAQAAMNDGMAMLKNKTMSGAAGSAVAQDSLDMLARGSAKDSGNVAADAAQQAGMRSQYENQALAAAKQKAADTLTAQEAAKKQAEMIAQKITQNQELTRNTLPGHSRDLDTVFDPAASQADAMAAQQKIVKQVAKTTADGLSTKGAKLEIEPSPITGVPQGFKQPSLDNFLEQQKEMVFDGAAAHLNSVRATPTFADAAAPDAVKAEALNHIRSAINGLDAKSLGGELRTSARQLMEAIPEHSANNTQPLRDALEGFHQNSIAVADDAAMTPTGRTALGTINGALKKLEIGSTSTPDAVNAYYAGYDKLMEIKGLLGANRGAQTPEAFHGMVRGMMDLAKTTNDPTASTVQPILVASHMQDVLSGSAEKPFYNMLNAPTRNKMDALEFLSNYAGPQKPGVAAKAPLTNMQRVAAAVSQGAMGLAGGSVLGGHGGMAGAILGAVKGATTGEMTPVHAEGGIRGLLTRAVQWAGQKAGDAAMSTLSTSGGVAGLRTYTGEQFEEQKLRGGR